MPLTVRQQGRKSGARGGLQSSSQMHNICGQANETFMLCPKKRHKSCFGVILADCVPINFYNLMWVAWLWWHGWRQGYMIPAAFTGFSMTYWCRSSKIPRSCAISLPALLQRFKTSGKTYHAGEYGTEYKWERGCGWHYYLGATWPKPRFMWGLPIGCVEG